MFDLGIKHYASIYPGRTITLGFVFLAIIGLLIYRFVDLEALGFTLPTAEHFGQTLLVAVIAIAVMVIGVTAIFGVFFVIWNLYAGLVRYTAVAWYEGKRIEMNAHTGAENRRFVEQAKHMLKDVPRKEVKANFEKPRNITEEVIKDCL